MRMNRYRAVVLSLLATGAGWGVYAAGWEQGSAVLFLIGIGGATLALVCAWSPRISRRIEARSE